MKVTLPDNYKVWMTVQELEVARQLIKDLREDICLNDYAQMAARVASRDAGVFEIFRAEAEISKSRVINLYSTTSKNLDIWLTIHAYHKYMGFYVIGVYLSDIWAIDGDNNEEIRSRMFIREYKETNT